MLNSFVLKIALRYLSAKKDEKLISVISSFSLLGIMIGVAALIVVMSVMNGFHTELVRNIRGLNGDISITSLDGKIDNFRYIQDKLLNEFKAEKVAPEIFSQSLAIGKSTSSGALVRGANLNDLRTKGKITENVFSGSFADFYGKDKVAIGAELAAALSLKVGDKLKLVSPNSISTAFGSMPRSKDFRVIAVFSSGVYDYDAATVLMPLEAAQNFLALGDAVNMIEVTIKSPDDAYKIAMDIRDKLHLDLERPIQATSWQMSNAQFLNALKVERVAMFTILSLIIVVAAFNIISSLFMIVNNKKKDIAILRTMGASKLQVMLIFICNGTMVGVIGTSFGVALGTGFAYNIEAIRQYLEQLSGTKLFEAALYYLYALPSEVKPSDVLSVAGLSMALCCLATIYPASKAANINPVDSLKYE